MSSLQGLCHGVYDGVSGIYKVPFRYVHDTNIVKAFPGIGAGMLSCVVKLTSGVAGTVMFPLQGLYTQLTEPESLDIPSPLELALAVVGHAEEFEADNQQRVSTLNAWRYLVQQDPILKKKFGKTLET
ncbi:glycosyltransferase family 1 protein [Penicillium waksmanii]|uniref:glycosyltransferase family 1 protein n=1 Tax=Penicillium waksmanii TaxID=69791 RepID=UPI0025491CF4|nr:glycosyltransferase family 1 protein [Penicillium waksmanii]KAJ6000963.1 glycosyltransferase family 1 protein [Penicillium waksmanii]